MLEAALVAHLGPERPFDLVQHDWGSYWGFLLAERMPERVWHVVALDVGLGGGSALRFGRSARNSDLASQPPRL